jgi:hypothetical protein
MDLMYVNFEDGSQRDCLRIVSNKIKLSLCFNWAPRHWGELGKWRSIAGFYMSGVESSGSARACAPTHSTHKNFYEMFAHLEFFFFSREVLAVHKPSYKKCGFKYFCLVCVNVSRVQCVALSVPFFCPVVARCHEACRVCGSIPLKFSSCFGHYFP